MKYIISYGKRAVPVYRSYATPLQVTPIPESPFTGNPNILFAQEIDFEVFGENFLPSYTHGDNRMVVATDSMKNFILRESLNYPGATLEGLLAFLGERFMSAYSHVEGLIVSGRQLPFDHVAVPGDSEFMASDRLFSRSQNSYATAAVHFRRTDEQILLDAHHSGQVGMRLLKVTGSAFTHFVRDGYTTLPERGDRPLYIAADLHWRYQNPDDLFQPNSQRYVAPEQMRDLMTTVFHSFVSESIQHLFHEIGSRMLERFPQLAEVSFYGQNLTRDPVVEGHGTPPTKIYTDPFPAYGQIKLTMQR